MRPRISIRGFVRPSVGPLVRPSVGMSRFCKKCMKLRALLYVVDTLTKSKLMKIRKIQTESKSQEIDKKVTESYRK